jgi:hypothetical protein
MMHTPGPWAIQEYGDDEAPSLVIHRDSKNRICFMATPGSHGDPAMIEADARLIVAAPELYEYVKSSASAGCATAQALITKIEGQG